MAQLNEGLAKKQKITQEQRDNLDNLYDYMDELIEQANSEKKMTPEKGKFYAERMKTLEFALQENWNFEKSELHHTWWNRFSGCLCPKMDNNERFGVEKIIRQDCPFHGNR
jgi:hypothetical protein